MKTIGFHDAVLYRHSVRDYSHTPVPEDALLRIMEAVRLSPSGGNSQENRFVIVRDAEKRRALSMAAGNQEWVANAPVIVACCSMPELPVGSGDDFGREVNVLRWGLPAVEMMEAMEDKDLLALLMGNGGTLIPGTHLTLAAAAEGLGTCWIGYLDIEAASCILGLPAEWRCYFLITLGYPAETQPRGGHDRMPLKDRVFLDSWGAEWGMASGPSPIYREGVADDDTIARIMAADARPEPFTPSDDLFWDHPHIAKGMLEAHLNPDWEGASRRFTEIDGTVGFLMERMGLTEGMSFLDCGCGPGLYCTRFAKQGLRVTGIDYSRNSIGYARERAREDGLDIRYELGNYLNMDFKDAFDAACIIYMDYCVLSPGDRKRFLENVHRALKPGGLFALDVHARALPLGEDGAVRWSSNPNGGFWRPGPYLEMGRHFVYPEEGVHLEQVMIAEPSGPMSVYRLWTQLFDVDSLTNELGNAGFGVEGMWETLWGRELRGDSPILAAIARKA